MTLVFRFFKRFWNNSYATEAARACINLGFNKFNLKTIVGRAMKANTASIKVLEKIGLCYDKEFDFDGQKGVVYKISNPHT